MSNDVVQECGAGIAGVAIYHDVDDCTDVVIHVFGFSFMSLFIDVFIHLFICSFIFASCGGSSVQETKNKKHEPGENINKMRAHV